MSMICMGYLPVDGMRHSCGCKSFRRLPENMTPSARMRIPSIDPIHAPIKIHVQSIGILLHNGCLWRSYGKVGSK